MIYGLFFIFILMTATKEMVNLETTCTVFKLEVDINLTETLLLYLLTVTSEFQIENSVDSFQVSN